MNKFSSSSVPAPVLAEDEASAAAPGSAGNLSGRAVPEWRGKHPDNKVPPRVRARIFLAHDGKCWITGRKIMPADYWELDHKVALVNGGEHAEHNLAPALRDAHRIKTRADVAEKSKVARMRARHIGIKKPSSFPCSKASPWRKKVSGEVVRR